jgi:hypothetical protein
VLGVPCLALRTWRVAVRKSTFVRPDGQVPAVGDPTHQQSKQLDLLLMSAKPVTDGRAHRIVSGRRSYPLEPEKK